MPPLPAITPSHSRPGLTRAAQYAAGTAVVCLLAVLIAGLAMGPVHGVPNAAGCERAYAEARSRTDTLAADLLSFPDPHGHPVARRCLELHAVAVEAPGLP